LIFFFLLPAPESDQQSFVIKYCEIDSKIDLPEDATLITQLEELIYRANILCMTQSGILLACQLVKQLDYICVLVVVQELEL